MSMKIFFSNFVKNNKKLFTVRLILFILLGTAISSFGLYNIHKQANITEGGILGMILVINHWTGLSPSILSPILDIFAYTLAFRYLGKNFIKVSLFSTVSMAGFFRLWEQFPPILPDLSASPLIAAIIGGVLIGIGTGLVIGQGGSGSGDDALAMAISKSMSCRIAQAYLVSDIAVLLLSLTYIPLSHIIFSFITVFISSYLTEFVHNTSRKSKRLLIENRNAG